MRAAFFVTFTLLSLGCGLSSHLTTGEGGSGKEGAESTNKESSSARSPRPGEYTYYADAKPVIDAKCAQCHLEDGIGPMPLTTYDEVERFGDLVRAAIDSGTMPPWTATDECGEYIGDRSLSDDQKAMLLAWIDDDMPEGDPEFEGDPLPADGRELPRVDEMLQLPEPYSLPEDENEGYQCFVMDWPHDEEMYITGINIVPDNRSVVHHAVLYMAPPGNREYYHQRDEADPESGYECFDSRGGVGGAREWVASYEPGGYGQEFPEGVGILVEPGATMVLQMHYDKTFGNSEPDQSWLEFMLEEEVPKPGNVELFLNPLWIGFGMNIPAGDSDVMHAWQGRVVPSGRAMALHWADLHMHQLGSSGTLSIERADGTSECLVDIPKYDFAWQETYMFRRRKIMYPGDQLRGECHWDNSPGNQPVVDGKRLTPEDRSWGDSSFDEMCLGNVLVSPL